MQEIMQIRLSDTFLSSSKQGEFWDTILPAFGVRKGKRRVTFLVNHENRRKKLGTYPQLSLKDARQKAADLIDGKVATDTHAHTALETYLNTIEVRPRTLAEYRRILNETLPKKNLRDITTRDITNILDGMLDRPSAARHAHVALKVFFNWCDKRDYIDTNPMRKLDPPAKHKTRSRVLTDDELRRVWISAGDMGRFGCIIRLCILTGQRKGEIAQIKSDWISSTSTQTKCHGTNAQTLQLLVIPAEVSKNSKEHSLPLTNSSLTLVEQLVQHSTKFNSWSKSKAKLDKLSGVTNWTIHDLRRTFATNSARLSVSPVVIERMLNHSAPTSAGGAIAAIYNRHDYLQEMKEALDKHEAWLLELVGSTG